jgi:hypothetical protein
MRLGLLSNEKLDPWINWSTLGPPLLSALATQQGVDLIAPPRLRWAQRAGWPDVIARVRSCDTLFWIQGGMRPAPPVQLASLAKLDIRRSAYVYDAFEPVIDRVGVAAIAQRLEPCFVAYREAVVELRRRYRNGRFEWLPFGVDTNIFRQTDPERPIFAFWMGRRYEPLHTALLDYCARRNLQYVYRTSSNSFLSPSELGDLAGRAKYFVVTPPGLDNPSRTGRFSPLVMRYMEGLAAGARLLGVLPRSGEYEALLPVEAICQVASDGSDLVERLDQDLASPDGWLAAERATELVRTHHSWEVRARQIYQRLSQ